MPKPQHSPARKPALSAATADRHVLYEASVQDPAADVAFIERVYKKARGRLPLSLREDFCGTAALCAEWVRRGKERRAVGLDLHKPTMAWGSKRHLQPLGVAAGQVRLLQRNVLDGMDEFVEATVAFNFSYCALRKRDEMRRYFEAVHRGTLPEGAFFLDIHGGSESFEVMQETTKYPGFTYVWDQGPYDPITGFSTRRIHFRFADGTEMKNAFTYPWRMWTLVELQDLLHEAGFAQVDVYWEGTDAKGGGNGVFRRARKGKDEASWIAYIVAWRTPAAA